MRISKFIKAARKANACQRALDWVELHPDANEHGLAEVSPAWYLWACGKIPGWPVDKKLLDTCAMGNPWRALEYVAKLLTKKRLDSHAQAHPSYALRYAAGLLTRKRLDSCAQDSPGVALECAAELLTKKRLDACAEAEPEYALMYAVKLLTRKRLDACAESYFVLAQSVKRRNSQ